MLKDLWAAVHGPAHWLGSGRKMIGRLQAKEFGLLMSMWQCRQSVKIFVSLVNAHQTVSATEEVLISQVNKMTWSVDISQSLQCQHIEHTNKVTFVAEVETKYGPNGTDSYSPRLVWLLLPLNL